MRIVSGSLGGRIIHSPKQHAAHPMGDRVKTALFNVLGSLNELIVLDAFSGSGALALEAVSRGAKQAVAVEKDHQIFTTLEQNVSDLKMTDRVQAIRANVASWSKNNQEISFDVIIADPPYNRLQLETVKELASHLKPTGVFVFSHPGEQVTLPGLEIVEHKNYGDASLTFYRRINRS